MSEQMLRMSVADFARTYWGIQLADKRLVVDILQNKVKETAVLLPITSNTGGVGKTTSSRQLADRASQAGLRVLLIDGNIRQSSQRVFRPETGQAIAYDSRLATGHAGAGRSQSRT